MNKSSKKNKKFVIWALYDDSNSSVKNAIKKHFPNSDYLVYSIGINNLKPFPEKNFIYKRIDLSLSNFSLFDQLDELEHPDVIMASPPCESWSGADCGGKMFTSINEDGMWVVKNASYYEKYNARCHPVKRRNFFQKETGRIIGESTIGATIRIIKHYEPQVWIIENPQTSKTWDFQKYHWGFTGEMNKATYSSYDKKFSLKPTIFKSNIKLDLKSFRGENNKDHMARGSYSKRSSIPSQLIADIVVQARKKCEESL